MPRSKFKYKAKDVLTGKWVYGNYVDQTVGCTDIIITRAVMQDNGDVEFDYHFVAPDTRMVAEPSQPRYVTERRIIAKPNGEEEDKGFTEVPRCPDCGRAFSEYERPNFCPNCGLPLNWSR